MSGENKNAFSLDFHNIYFNFRATALNNIEFSAETEIRSETLPKNKTSTEMR